MPGCIAPHHFATGNPTRWWTFATDARVLVGLAGILPGTEPMPPENRSSTGIVNEYLSREPTWQDTIPFEALSAWCGAAEYRQPCPCGSFCDDCAGDDGWIYPKRRLGRVLGTCLDRLLLARALACVEPQPVRWGWHAWQGNRPLVQGKSPDPDSDGFLVIEPVGPKTGDGTQPLWRIILMPIVPQDAEISEEVRLGAGLLTADLLDANESRIRRLLATIREEKRWDLLPILADAIEEAGGSVDVAGHLREPHGAAGCWVVEGVG